jgi:hypothetical protein
LIDRNFAPETAAFAKPTGKTDGAAHQINKLFADAQS